MNLLKAIDLAIIIAFFVLSLSIGLLFKKKASKNLTSFFLGGRNLPWFIAGLSMVATTFAADTPLAVTELVNKSGISGNWLWWNALIGGMLTTFFFAELWRRANVLTEIEFIKIRYGENKPAKFLRYFKSLYLGLFINTLIIAWVNLALITILQVYFGIDKSETFIYVIIAMTIAALYSSLSGLIGVAITDAIQFFIAIGGAIILAVFVVNSNDIGGMQNLIDKLPLGSLNFFPEISTASDSIKIITLGIGSLIAYIGIQWWASWYPGAEPGGGGYIAQRMMSTKTEKDSFLATLFFQIFHYVVRPWPWIIVALATIILYPELSADEKRLGYIMAIKDYLPSGVQGLLLTSIFAAYMSTISTHLNWGASYLINDFAIPVLKIKKPVVISKLTTIILMITGAFATTFISSISEVWKFLFETGAGLGLVLILRWYWWRINVWAEIAATFSPFFYYFISKYFLNLDFPEGYFFTVGFTTITWVVVMLISKPDNKTTLLKFTQQIKPEGFWGEIYTSNNSKIKYKLISWLFSIVGAYSILFAIGKFLFFQYNEAVIFTIIGIFSLTIVYLSINKQTSSKKLKKITG